MAGKLTAAKADVLVETSFTIFSSPAIGGDDGTALVAVVVVVHRPGGAEVEVSPLLCLPPPG